MNAPDFQRKEPVLTLALNYVVASLELSATKLGGEAHVLLDVEYVVSAVELLSNLLELKVTPFVKQWDDHLSDLGYLDPPSMTYGGTLDSKST